MISEPHIGADENGCATFEWWDGQRKLTLYTVSPPDEALLKSWGANISSEMEWINTTDAEAVRAAFEWLVEKG
jgi:hypothetical protein